MRPVSRLILCACAAANLAARDRAPFDQGWRFFPGDPPGTNASLLYEVRPDAREPREAKPADAQPTAVESATASTRAGLKPWILPTANPFIRLPRDRHAAPEKEWSGDIACVRADFDDRAWQRVDLPHDWAIAGPFITTGGGGMGRLPSAGIGWYRKQFELPAANAGQSLFLEIDGAMSYATVWCNGRLVGGWPYGYASWQANLTPFVTFSGRNVLAVRLDNPPSSSRWYPGGGIYRHVWLTQTTPVHVGQWGTHLTTREDRPGSAIVYLSVTLDNDASADARVSVATEIFAADATGRPRGDAVAFFEPVATVVDARSHDTVAGATRIEHPKLWGPPPRQQPNRYVAVTTITRDGRAIDTYETRFGIRTLRFDPDHGLFVNAQPVRLQGVNQHHDLGALGAAFNARAAERQLELLREMGCNAIRLSHNPPAPELLELTDRMGFLVMDEAFDAWERGKTPLDFHLVFPDWQEPDLRALVRRDRNHPSVVVWSIGNEVGEQYTGDEGAAVARRLRDIVREEDPTRPVTSAMNFAKSDMPLPAVLDVIGLNYQGEGIRQEPEFAGTDRIRTPPQYPLFHAKFPDKLILSSETASAFSSRGVYLFPVAKETSAPVRDNRGGDAKNRQVTAYELHAVDFGSSADKVFASLDRHPFVAGEFVWTGWDYLGEPTPYDRSRSSYCGIVDLAGFKKDRFYLYQARWRPELPMAHLLPHWTWPERVGQVTPVHVFTSGDEAELFLNGRSLGRKRKGAFEYRLRWDDVVYEPGTLEIVAYRDEKKWATDVVRTAGEPARLELTPDRATIAADGRDLSFVTVRVVDENGGLAPRANSRLVFQLDGPGEIVATDNGDATDLTPFPAHERNAFNGLCLVIVRAKPGQPGRLRLTASGDGMKSGDASITASAP